MGHDRPHRVSCRIARGSELVFDVSDLQSLPFQVQEMQNLKEFGGFVLESRNLREAFYLHSLG